MAYFEDNSISHNVETVGNFRAWAKKIHEALEKAGLVNTADTGQVNLETVELPAISTFAGYEIWRFNDARQGAEPIYLKIEYGRAAATSRPNLRVQWGTGSNGSGALTNASAQLSQTPTGTPEGNGYIYCCLVDGAFCLLSCAKPTENSSAAPNFILFAGERLKNAEYETLNGFTASQGAAGSQLASWTTWVEGGWKATEVLRTSGSASYGGLVYPGLVTLISPVISAPLRCVVGGKDGVIGSLDTGKLKIHTTERLFFRLPIEHKASFVGGATGATEVNHNYLLLHE